MKVEGFMRKVVGSLEFKGVDYDGRVTCGECVCIRREVGAVRY